MNPQNEICTNSAFIFNFFLFFSDMIKIMQDLGAVNAASLDGGSSTQMFYEGEYLNTPYALSGPRIVPNAFLVRPEDESKPDD